MNTRGFNLWRSVDDGTFAQVNASLIPVQNPGSVVGGSYAFVDTGVVSNEKYTYKLEEVEVSGATNWYGPVMLFADAAPTAVMAFAVSAQSGALAALLPLVLLGGSVYVRARRKRRD